MPSKYDQLRDAHSKAAPSPEPAERHEPEHDQAARMTPPTLADASPRGSSAPAWSLDQSMAAQNASANAWVKSRNQTPPAHEEERDAPEVEVDQEFEPELDAREPEQEGQGERRLRFYEDREGSLRERGDRADLKREQSEAEPSKTDGAERTLSFARDRTSAPDLER